jgi:hypothetical protein
MGQFKPMVKMMTTEPTVELKLKKGGHVNMKKGGKAESGHKKMAMGGGALDMMSGTPALVGRPAVNAPVRAPGKPSMASRRKAMMPKKPAMAMPPMKEGGESKKTHMAEMSKMKGLEKELKSHESKPASKGHKGLKTGGVALGNAGGFKKGGDVKKYAKGGVAGNGIINTEKQGGKYRDTLMHTAEYTGKSSGKTGDVKMGNGGGYKTGGVALGNAGGFKAGGKTSKKAYAAGGTVNSGRPVAMPQGAKKPSTSVSINQLSGTFKKGGKVTPAEGRLQKNFAAENKTAMKQAKAQSNEVYSKYGKMKMADGGMASGEGAVTDRERKMMEEAMPKGVGRITDEVLMKANRLSPKLFSKLMELRGNGSVTDAEHSAMQRMMEEGVQAGTGRLNTKGLRDSMMQRGKSQSDIDSLMGGLGAITETERSVTMSPAGKKRGGRAC